MTSARSAVSAAVLCYALAHAQVPTWTNTAPMQVVRTSASAALLPSGKVLIAGGRGQSGEFLSETEIYDPASGQWTVVASLPVAHAPLAAVLRSGDILVVSGDVPTAPGPTAYIFNEHSSRWSTAAPPSLVRFAPVLALLPGGAILMAGGDDNANTTYASTEIYDPSHNVWIAGPPMATRRTGHTATVLSTGKVLVIGGSFRTPAAIHSSVELYDPASNNWFPQPLMYNARSSHTATLLPSGKILVAGGFATSFNDFTATAEIFDPVFGVWTRTGSMTTPRAQHTAALLPNGKVLVAGGRNAAGVLSSAELYDPATGTWTAASSMTVARAGANGLLLPDGRVLDAGGVGPNGVLASAELFAQGGSLAVSTDPLPPAAIGSLYTYRVQAAGGKPPFRWSATGLPSWLNIGMDGTLGGIPPANAPAAIQLGLSVSDSANNSANAAVTLRINLPIAIAPAQLQPASENVLYAVGYSATGGAGRFTWSAGGLPNWLSMSAVGTLSGVPPTGSGGAYNLSVTATDSANNSATIGARLVVATSGALRIATVSVLPDATAGSFYSQKLVATGGLPPYRWAEPVSLAPGFTLSPLGLLSGTPIETGDASFTARALDSTGATTFGVFSVRVNPPPLALATTSPLADGVLGVPFSQTFTVSGGQEPIVWSAQGTLPVGMSFSQNGILQGTPGRVGAYVISVLATAADGVVVTRDYQFSVQEPSSVPVYSLGSLAFNAIANGSRPREQNVSIITTTALPLTYSTRPDAPWITVTPPRGTMPATFRVGIAQGNMAPGLYRGNITVTSTNPAPNSQPFITTLPVTLNITGAAPALAITPADVSLFENAAAGGSASISLILTNTGSGPVDYRVSLIDLPGAAVSPSAGTVAPNATIPLALTMAAQAPGYTRGRVQVEWDGGSAGTLVKLFAGAKPKLQISESGIAFDAVESIVLTEPGPQTFTLIGSDATPIVFNVQQLDNANWLILNTTSGRTTSTAPATVSFLVDASGLRNGIYYSTLRITSDDALNTPRDVVVVLHVNPPGGQPVASLAPGGLVFVSPATSVPPLQPLQVFSDQANILALRFAGTTEDGGSWLTAQASATGISGGNPAQLLVNVNPARLAPGVYHGKLSVSLGTAAVRSVAITLVVPAPGPRPGAACVPTSLALGQTALQDNFVVSAVWPWSIAARVLDDCGNAMPNASVAARFSNGDSDLALDLADPQSGRFSGTWYPVHPSPNVTVTLTATAPGFVPVQTTLLGEVDANNAPALRSDGPLHIFDPLAGAALAPGTLLQMYGSKLTGPVVTFGGLAVPVFYSTVGQINTILPFELGVGREYEVRAISGAASSGPRYVVTQPLSPGVAAALDGHVIAQHADFTLVSSNSPAQACEVVTAYFAGLGAADVPLSTGAPSPSSPPANVLNVPVVQINVVPAEILFAGLTPGTIGLYQVNFRVPKGTAAGDARVEIAQGGIPANTTLLPIGAQPVCQ